MIDGALGVWICAFIPRCKSSYISDNLDGMISLCIMSKLYLS